MVDGRAIASFRKSYPGIVIPDVIKDYSDFRLLAKKAQVQVDAGRANRESILGQTQEYMEMYRQLRDAVDVLDVRILTAIILPCACHAEPQKTGRGWVQVATLYRLLSLAVTTLKRRQRSTGRPPGSSC